MQHYHMILVFKINLFILNWKAYTDLSMYVVFGVVSVLSQ